MNENLNIRSMILEEVSKHSKDQSLQRNTIFMTLKKNFYGDEMQQAFLTAWHDLFRSGILAWGLNLNNPDAPFFHITEIGRKTLSNLSRDPSNPAGYLAALDGHLPKNSIAESYIKEALETYNSNCHKASAVMIGAAAESLVLGLRDVITERLTQLNATPPKDLNNWRTKRVMDALQTVFDKNKSLMNSSLYERYETYWSPFVGHIRMARNEAGHPNTLAPLAHDVVHGSLLIFPELAKLISDLSGWARSELK